MSERFPHLNDTAFPMTSNIDAYDYQNDYDYSQYNEPQMEIVVCRVPWDVGNVHVGNSVIPGLGNVVYFDGGEEERNAFFDNIPTDEKYVWQTKFSQFHSEGTIRLPVPFDQLAQYNYVYVRYNEAPNATHPLDYETAGGIKRWFYFVREMKRISPSTTELTLLRDSWQTFIYGVDIPYIRLERGHYGIAKSDVAKYLENPMDNGDWVLGEDDVYGDGRRVTDAKARILNDGNMRAVIFTWSDPRGSYGTAQQIGWRTTAANYPHQNGVTAPFAFSCPVDQFDAHMASIFEHVPQFPRTIQGVAFIPEKMLDLGQTFIFAAVQWQEVSTSQKNLDPVAIADLDFGIPEDYAHLAKMYTSPYAWIEITDFEGASHVVRIEETTGTLELQAAANLVFPSLNYQFTVNGVGGSSQVFDFYQLDRRDFKAGGAWYDYIFKNEIPVFALAESGEQAVRYMQWWNRDASENSARVARHCADRSTLAAKEDAVEMADVTKVNSNAGAKAAYDNSLASNATNQGNANRQATATQESADASADTAYSNAVSASATSQTNANASASTANANATASATAAYNSAANSANTAAANAKRSADAAKTNADRGADALVTNTNTQTAANLANTYASTASAAKDTNYANQLSKAQLNWTLGYNQQTTNNEQDSNTASAVVGAASSAISGIAGALSGGGIGAAVQGAVGAATSAANCAIQNNLLEQQAVAYGTYQTAIYEATSNNNTQRTEDISNVLAEDQQQRSNEALTAQAGVNSATTKASATLDKTTAYTNAEADQTTTITNARNTRSTDYANADRTEALTNANAQRSYNTETSIAADTRSTAKANNLRAYTAATSNASATKTTADANAKRTYDATLGNNDRSYDQSVENAERDYETNLLNNEESMEAALYTIEALRRDQKLDAPYVHGIMNNTGDATVKPQGLIINACRQPDSLMRQTGDNFLKWGYPAHRSIEFETFNVMPRFSFWKCEDISMRSVQLADAYLDDLRFLLIGGVTVWRRPEDIQNYSIWQNK